MHILRDAVLVLIVTVIFAICILLSSVKASQGPQAGPQSSVQVVPLPTLCGNTKEFLSIAKEMQYEPVIYKVNDEGFLITIFMTKTNDMIVAKTLDALTCILVNESDVEINYKKLLPES